MGSVTFQLVEGTCDLLLDEWNR